METSKQATSSLVREAYSAQACKKEIKKKFENLFVKFSMPCEIIWFVKDRASPKGSSCLSGYKKTNS